MYFPFSASSSKGLLSILICLAALAAPMLAFSQSPANRSEYPSRPVRIVVGYAPGGGADLIARTIAERLTKLWRVPIIVDNKPGANGSISAAYVAQAPADGYTLLMAYTPEIAINNLVTANKSYDAQRDLRAISLTAESPLILVVNSKSPYKTVADFVKAAKKNPNRLTYGTSGENSSGDLAGKILDQAAGISLLHVPYKGGSGAILDLLAGRLDSVFTAVPPALAHFQSKQLIPLAVTTKNRSLLLPDTPSFNELGIPVDISAWFGLFAPSHTPEAIISTIDRDVTKVMKADSLKDRLLAQGMEPRWSSPDEFSKFIDKEIEKYRQIIKKKNTSAQR